MFALFHAVQMKERKQKAEREAVTLVECWEMRRKRWNIVSCAFCPPPTQEVNQCYWILLPLGMFRSQNTHTHTHAWAHTHEQKASHTISTPLRWNSDFPLYHCYILNSGAQTLETYELLHKADLLAVKYQQVRLSRAKSRDSKKTQLSASQKKEVPWKKYSISSSRL